MNHPETIHSDAARVSGMPTGIAPNSEDENESVTPMDQSGAVEKASQHIRSAAESAARAAKAEAQRAGAAAGEKVDQIRDHASSATESIVNEKKNQFLDQLAMVTQSLDRASEKLRDDQHGSIARYADLAAEKVESCRQAVESKSLGDFVDDAQDFTRRRPALVFGVLFVAGLAAMRVMKATSRDRSEQQMRRKSAARDWSNQHGDRHSLTPQQASVVTDSNRFSPSINNQKS